MVYNHLAIVIHVIDNEMKKIFILIGIVTLLSCKSKIGSIDNEEILIVHKALMISNPNHTEINVIAEPNNNSVINFKNGGFDDDEYNIYTNKFYFKKNRITTWDKQIILDDNNLYEKIHFIKSKNEIPKVGFNDTINAKIYHVVSNVMFSDDGKLAIINIASFSNLPIAQYYEEYTYVFKKEDNEWIYSFNFLVGIS